MLSLIQRNVIRGYLDKGMSPEDIANYIGRLNDLDYLETVTIRSAVYDMLNESTPTSDEKPVEPPLLSVVAGADI